ncbi:hypothetical protein DPMN_082926 [Dreissena polymorpha]|uniref:Uncharacterized protein n=1 Tax=Dreissena polymorpha TaxID=45954 RepID=A0A9D4BAL3_DREPO|nr:hypothetical protein DPMN_082926 [Dreissena polymorpha]
MDPVSNPGGYLDRSRGELSGSLKISRSRKSTRPSYKSRRPQDQPMSPTTKIRILHQCQSLRGKALKACDLVRRYLQQLSHSDVQRKAADVELIV